MIRHYGCLFAFVAHGRNVDRIVYGYDPVLLPVVWGVNAKLNVSMGILSVHGTAMENEGEGIVLS